MTGVRADGKAEAFDAVISTVPMPFVSRLVPGLPDRVEGALRRDQEHRRLLPGVQAEDVGHAAFLGQHIGSDASKFPASSSSRTCGRPATRSSSCPTTCR